MRLWLPLWRQDRIPLTVRADNYTVIAMASRMKAKTDALRIIACEMALLLADSCYMPWVAEHTPGIQHGVADVLSRRLDPHFRYKLPAVLQNAKLCQAPIRNDAWYKALRVPRS